ncbi:MAG: hypothetical protein IJS15_11100, partial [Victivallales bacterium]|nr:hypothetical protein [Victivallales bacterium]
MNPPKFISRLIDCWEKVFFVLSLLLCIVFCIIGAMFFTELPEARMPAGNRPTATRLLPWDLLSDKFFHPPIPPATNANPFVQRLVNHLKPKPAPQPPVTPQPAPEPPKPEPPKAAVQESDTPPKAPIEVAAKPDIIISVTYKGFFIDLAGDPVAFISVANSQDNSHNRIICKKGTPVTDKITLEAISENSASFKTDDGETVTIPWN